MLQCHPHPGDFTDKTKPFHCWYFMGLQRKQGTAPHESEKFDIRATVEEFKQAVNKYMMRRPGMTIHVSHLTRKNIPNFVFPGGVRPPRPSNISWDARRLLEMRAEKLLEMDEGRKRKREEAAESNAVRSVKPLATVPSSSSYNIGITAAFVGPTDYGAGNNGMMREKVEVTCSASPVEVLHTDDSGTPCSKEAENIAIQKINNTVSYVETQTLTEELDELEDDFGHRNQQQSIQAVKTANAINLVSLKSDEAAASACSDDRASSSTLIMSSSRLEELEVLPSKTLLSIITVSIYV